MAHPFTPVRCSLADLAGAEYVSAVCEARAALSGESAADLLAEAQQPVDFYPQSFHERLLARLPQVGQRLAAGLSASAGGATSEAFAGATHTSAAPLTGYGFYRVGEDGRLCLVTKSEHYHTPLGHAFPGYGLLETARRLGIPNATHNNTRGHLTRLLEERLVAAAGGGGAQVPALQVGGGAGGGGAQVPALQVGGGAGGGGAQVPALQGGLWSLDRVLNLETGSLAVEAGVKMMLARFYRVQEGAPEPPCHGRVPVFLVMGDEDGGPAGNYHGTTVPTQLLRGMWPELKAALGECGLVQVCALRPNSREDLEAAFERYGTAPYQIAGFLHEIVMMNYGAVLLEREYLQHAYELCARQGVPTLVDEIQSCLWAPGLFQFREWGLRPSLVAVGKGFPGGEYPASRLLFSEALDTLPQFGALVTNGQEELASLAYLVTMRWAQANETAVTRLGDLYEGRLRELAARHPGVVAGVSGRRHLSGIAFHSLPQARAFCAALNAGGLDISVQTYKADCPPAALTKLPLTACEQVIEFVVGRMREALAG